MYKIASFSAIVAVVAYIIVIAPTSVFINYFDSSVSLATNANFGDVSENRRLQEVYKQYRAILNDIPAPADASGNAGRQESK